jgi:arsenite methyltransferase
VEESRQEEVKEAVKAYYGVRAQGLDACSCSCGPTDCCGPAQADEQSVGYSEQDLRAVPDDMQVSSLGCGDPLAFADIREKEVVLDLGSGLGLDVMLAARRVGHGGKVIGLDMTPEMIDKARQNAERAGLEHIVEFRLGEMEKMPVDDESVDWIISNCVVNLSPDKERVFQEAYRVLKPGGQMLISDLVSAGLPDELRKDLSAWAQCLGGTLEEVEYLDLFRKAGFEEVAVVDRVDATPAFLVDACCSSPPQQSGGLTIDSIKVRARKRRLEQ